MKLRLMPVILTVVCSSVILFGGWFVYHSYAMENPLDNIVTNSPGVQDVQTDISGNQVTFDLKLGDNADLRQIYDNIHQDGSHIIGSRDIKLNVTSDSSPELDKWWSSALFDVAQAMETHEYASIPKSLQAKAAEQTGLSVQTDMDDTNVYVRLTDGNHVKYVILPRIPAKMGVWPNE